MIKIVVWLYLFSFKHFEIELKTHCCPLKICLPRVKNTRRRKKSQQIILMLRIQLLAHVSISNLFFCSTYFPCCFCHLWKFRMMSSDFFLLEHEFVRDTCCNDSINPEGSRINILRLSSSVVLITYSVV